jgi:hypothetical protein
MSRPISAGYLERKVRAITGVAQSNPLGDLEDVLAGLIVLENDRMEWGFPANEFYGFIQRAQIAVAAQFSHVAVVNPPGTSVIVVVEDLTSSADSSIFIASPADLGAGPIFLAGSTASVGLFERDLRIKAGGVFATRVETGSNVVVPWQGPCWPVSGPNDTRRTNNFGMIIPPGRAIIVAPQALNTALTVGFAIRERPIEGTFEIK